jgi:LAO/AO transport system kinase
MWSMVEERVLSSLRDHPGVRALAPQVETRVAEGTLTPTLGAHALLDAFGIDDP